MRVYQRVTSDTPGCRRISISYGSESHRATGIQSIQPTADTYALLRCQQDYGNRHAQRLVKLHCRKNSQADVSNSSLKDPVFRNFFAPMPVRGVTRVFHNPTTDISTCGADSDRWTTRQLGRDNVMRRISDYSRNMRESRSFSAFAQRQSRRSALHFDPYGAFIARTTSNEAQPRVPNLGRMIGVVEVPALSQYALGIGYWQKVFKPYLQGAIAVVPIRGSVPRHISPFQDWAQSLIDTLDTVIVDNVKYPSPESYDYWVSNTRRASWYISTREYRKRLRRIYPHFRAIRDAFLAVARSEDVGRRAIGQIFWTLATHWRRLKYFWKTSGQYACGSAAERVVDLGRNRGVRRFYKAIFLWKAPQKIDDTVIWYRNSYSLVCPNSRQYISTVDAPNQAQWRPRPLYKGRRRKYSHTIQYSPALLKRVAKALILSISSGIPVHARVLSGYIHERKLATKHSIVIHKFDPVNVNPAKMDFTAIDVDGGATIKLTLDSQVPGGKFEHNPGDSCWFYSPTSKSWDYDRSTGKAPWRYQIMGLWISQNIWREARRKQIP